MSPRRQCRCRTRTFFGLVLKFSPGPLLWLTLVSPIWFPFWLLDPLCASLLRFCASPVKAIGFPFHFRDGDDGIRTHDPLLAGQVLSQLSYTPIGLSDLFSLSMSLSLTEN